LKRALIVMALMAPPLFADNVLLKGGGRLTGEITDQTADSVTVDIGAGKMTVAMATVVEIEKTTSPLQEYRAHAAALNPNDLDGWRNLGRWATQHALSAQAHEAYSHVHDALPDDAEANRALGLVLHEGRWIPEEESYKARGFVKFGGDWMTPAERDAIMQEEHTRREANREEVKAQVITSENERKAREAEEARIEQENALRFNNLPTLGDPVWGYGYVPAVWPSEPGRLPR
jgi:hypothetical protein